MNTIFKKRLIMVAAVLIIFSAAAGCGPAKPDSSTDISIYGASYSNLVDRKSQEILQNALTNAGVPEASVNRLLDFLRCRGRND